MRFTIKKFGVVVCAALGLVTAAFAMWHGHYWSAVGLLIAGLMMGTQCLLGFDCIKNTTLGFVGTILFVASSWAAVVTESPGFDIEGQTIKVAVAMAAEPPAPPPRNGEYPRLEPLAPIRRHSSNSRNASVKRPRRRRA